MSDSQPGRHPSVAAVAKYLVNVNPNLRGEAAIIAVDFAGFTERLLGGLPDSPETTAGLRKLLEAKDCFVRASLPEVGPTG